MYGRLPMSTFEAVEYIATSDSEGGGLDHTRPEPHECLDLDAVPGDAGLRIVPVRAPPQHVPAARAQDFPKADSQELQDLIANAGNGPGT